MDNLTTNIENLMTLKEVAIKLNVHYNTVYRWTMLEGILPYVRIGGRYFVKKEALEAFINGEK